MKQIKLSILIPIFNVEKYIRRCAESLFNQTLKEDIEYIFVNDDTKDRSIAILEEVLNNFPERKNQVKIIQHERNKGIGQTRLTAIENATGEYIAFCDSDDWIEPSMYEKLLRVALLGEYDIVGCDFVIEGTNGDQNVVFNYENKSDILRDVLGNRWGTVWKYIVRRSLVESIKHKFSPRICHGEDYIMTSLLLLNASSYHHIDERLYHYNCQNSSSLMHNVTQSAASEQVEASEIVFAELKKRGLDTQYQDEINVRKIFTRIQSLLAGLSNSSVYPEVKGSYWKNSRISVRKKFILSLLDLLPVKIASKLLRKLS